MSMRLGRCLCPTPRAPFSILVDDTLYVQYRVQFSTGVRSPRSPPVSYGSIVGQRSRQYESCRISCNLIYTIHSNVTADQVGDRVMSLQADSRKPNREAALVRTILRDDITFRSIAPWFAIGMQMLSLKERQEMLGPRQVGRPRQILANVEATEYVRKSQV